MKPETEPTTALEVEVTELRAFDTGALVERIYHIIRNSKRLPLTNRLVVDEQHLLALAEHIQDVYPDTIKKARLILADRDRLFAEARAEAERIIQQAETRASELSSHTGVSREAERLMDQARQVSREMHQGALAYADDVLGGLEHQLGTLLTTIQVQRHELSKDLEPKAQVVAEQGQR